MNSKINIKSILIITIIAIVSLVYFNQSFAANTAKVNVEAANIRKTADENSTIIDQISKNQEVEILEKVGKWYKIKYNNIQGYLRSDLLDTEEENKTDDKNNTTTNVSANDVKTNTITNTSNNENTQAISNTVNSNTTNTTSENVTNVNSIEKTTQSKLSSEVNIEKNVEYICKEKTKLKIMPLIIGNDLKEIEKSAKVKVLEVNNKWALVECEGNRGWMLVDKLQNETSSDENQEQQENNDGENTDNEETQNEQTQNNEENNEENTEQQTETTNTEQQENTENQENVTSTEKTQETTAEVQEKTMYVNSEIVNLRKEESTSSESLAKLSKGTVITVVSTNNGWSKVKVNDKEGYISSALLSETKPEIPTSRNLEEPRQEENDNTANTENNEKQETTSTKNEETSKKSSSSSSKGEDICAYAKQYLGCKYVYGGTSPKGFDCSGFTQYVYKHFGTTINRTADAQASNGTHVNKSDLKAGDLLIFKGHAGIYLGNGRFIHAANPKKGVVTTSLSDSYYVRNYITARRIID